MNQRIIQKMRIPVVLVLTFLCLGLCACGKNSKPEGYGKVNFELVNSVTDRISVLAVSWSIDGNTVGTTGVEVAGGGKYLGERRFSYAVTSEDVTDEKELDQLSVTIKVTEADGGSFDVPMLLLPSKFGDEYEFELYYEDGCYNVRECK